MTCINTNAIITDVSRADYNDITSVFALRYRLASDPDVTGSYTVVTTTKTFLGITYWDLDITTLDPGDYVAHGYEIAAGTGTGSKVAFTVACDDAS